MSRNMLVKSLKAFLMMSDDIPYTVNFGYREHIGTYLNCSLWPQFVITDVLLMQFGKSGLENRFVVAEITL